MSLRNCLLSLFAMIEQQMRKVLFISLAGVAIVLASCLTPATIRSSLPRWVAALTRRQPRSRWNGSCDWTTNWEPVVS